MQILTSTPLLDYAGDPVKVNGQDFTFRDAFMQALSQMTPDESRQGQGAEVKAKIYAISVKLFKSDKVNLTVDEAALVKERCGFNSTPLVYGRVCGLLEGEEQDVPEASTTTTTEDEANTTETATTTEAA